VIKIALKVFLLAVVPLLTLGLSVFEGSSMYAGFVGLRGVDRAISTKLTTQYGDAHRMLIDRASSREEFDHLWALARRYSSAKLPAEPPLLIGRIAIENGASVDVPGQGKVILIPESVPVFALWCPESELAAEECTGNDAIMLGTVGDVRAWGEKKTQAIRSTINFCVAAISIALGLAVEFGLTEQGS